MAWEKFVENRRIQIALVAGLGFALCIGLYEGVIAKHATGRDTGLKAAYGIVNVWEAGIFGFGIAFFFVYGEAIRRLAPGTLKNRCIGIWLSISYFFISWFPHASVHQFLIPTDPTGFIILEICFHWPNLAAAFVLCYYQFDVLLLTYGVALNNKTLRNWKEEDALPKKWYKNTVYHGIVLSILGAAGWVMLSWKYLPFVPGMEMWHKVIFVIIYCTDGITSGIGIGFAYSASFVAYRLPKKRTRQIAGISIAAITFLLLIATPHPVVHNVAAPDPYHILTIEYTFHPAITIAVSIVAYFQHRFLVMAISGRVSMGILKYKSGMSGASKTSDASKGSRFSVSDSELRNMSKTSGENSGVEVQQVSVTVDKEPNNVVVV